MAWLDDKGRFLGKVNLLDLAIIIGILVTVSVAWVRLTQAWRPPTRFPYSEKAVRVEIDIVLPPGRGWLLDVVREKGMGAVQRDTRSGEPTAQLLAARWEGGNAVVTAWVWASRDERGALFYESKRLTPGMRVVLETTACVVEGHVLRFGLYAETPEQSS